jgi:hypothetical protein
VNKNRRKAANHTRVSPEQLWETFHAKFPDGVNPYEFDRLGPKFMADISKVSFSFENFFYSHLDENLGRADGFLGYRKFWTRLPLTCFSYIGCLAGGDWEFPLYFPIYMDKDGKTFRGYIPQKGNVWNYATKKAFGNDDQADKEFLIRWARHTRPEVHDRLRASDAELETDDADILSNPEAMASEMMLRFEAV